MSDNKKFDRFGRYLILDHLVDGGMAKICRSRFLGEQADKIVAIKMVQPQFSKDESFKTMFMDEIKTTFGLLHPNIVQTYDYGFQNDQLFVAMEYCDGRNLKQFLDKLKERNYVFPVEISVYIAIQACLGLHYAHTFTDKLTGKPANIVHRDISPHNIMLTYDGAIKIIDFGIAKSETNSEATQAGTIKGKLSYLAPEYLDGLELDPRYDLFATGITLWEMLCSRKLFKASNDLAVLKKIQECKIPRPSSINPNVPEELDRILMKALSKDRNKRHANLEEFARELNKFLYSTYPDFNASDLSYFAKELFKEEIKVDRERMFEYGQIELRPYLDDLKREVEGGSNPSAASATTQINSGTNEPTLTRKAKETELDFDFDEDVIPSGENNHRSASEKISETRSAINRNLLPTKTKTSRSALLEKTSTNTKITKKARKKIKAKEPKGTNPLFYAASIAIVCGFLAFKFLPNFSGDVNKVATSVDKQEELTPTRNPSSEQGRLKLKNFNKRVDRVFVNGKEATPDTLSYIYVDPGINLTVRVERPGYEFFVEPSISVGNGEIQELEVRATPEARYGYLMTSRACASGTLFFNLFGEEREEPLPIGHKPGIAFPVSINEKGEIKERQHEVYFKRTGQDIKKEIKFTISESKVVDLCRLL